MKIRLVGTESNRDGIGAKVWVQTSKKTQFKEATCGGSYASGSDSTLHFGIGTQEMIQSIKVKWQSGRNQTVDFPNPVNQVIRIIENSSN